MQKSTQVSWEQGSSEYPPPLLPPTPIWKASAPRRVPAGANFYMLNKSTLPYKTCCVIPTCGKSLAKSPNVQHEFAKASLVHKGKQVLRHKVCQVLPTANPPPACLRFCSLLSVSIQNHPSPPPPGTTDVPPPPPAAVCKGGC